MQDGTINNIVNGKLVIPNGDNKPSSGISNISDGKLIVPKQDSFQDDAIKDVSDKMENAVKNNIYLGSKDYLDKIQFAQSQMDAYLKDIKTSVPDTTSDLEKINNTIKEYRKQYDAYEEEQPIMFAEAVEQSPFYPALLTMIRTGKNFTEGKIGAGLANIGNTILQGAALPFTVPFGYATEIARKTGEVGGTISDVVEAPFDALFSSGKVVRDFYGVDLGESVNELFDTLTGIVLTGSVVKGGKGILKSFKGSKTSTDVQGKTFSENPTNISPDKQLRQSSDYKASEVGDTKINLTPQEELAISKDKLAYTDLTNRTLELTNKQMVLTEQLKKSKTKANKTALSDVNKQLEDITAERNAIEDKLNAFGAYTKQRELKGLISERGTSTKGIDVSGENAPSFINFTAAKDPLGRTITNIAPERLQPVKTSIQDVNEFKNALSEVNKTIKITAEEIKPDIKQIGDIKDATPQSIVESEGLVYNGIQKTKRGDYVTWTDPETGSTHLLPMENLTKEALLKQRDEYRVEGVIPPEQSNRVIPDSANKWADDYLKSKLGDVNSNPFVDYQLYGALLTKGAYHFENGVIRFSEWSKKLVDEYGDKIKPVLIDIWNEIQKDNTLKQTAIANTLKGTEKTNKLNTAVKVEANAPELMPFQHNLRTTSESLIFNTMGKYVEKQGEAGKALVDAGNKVYRESSQLASKYITLYHNDIILLDKFPKLAKEFIKIANEGGTSTNPLVNKALDSWKIIRTELSQKAIEQQMTMSYFDVKSKTFIEIPFEPIENFFPHKFDFNKIRSAKFQDQFINNLASKLDISRPQALRIWNEYIRRNTINEMKNIERVRQFDVNGWREEISVIPEYIQDSARRLKEVEIFGKNYEKANEIIAQIDKTGGDFTSAQTLFDRWVGRDRYNRDVAAYVSKINSWQVLNKLGLLTFLNWTQIGNAGILFNTKSFAKTLVKQIKNYPELRKYVEPTGALDNTLAAYRLDSMSSTGMGDFMLRKTGVVTQERWNRVFSANVGMDYMKSQLESLIKNPNNKRLRDEMQRKIDMLGLTKEVNIDNALKNGKFTEKELLDIGYEGARKTQFLSRPQDLPNFMSKKDLKFFTLFKSFVIQQSTLVKDAVLKETFKGNIKPLLFMATIFPALGEIANTARAIVSGDKKMMDESLLLHKQEWSKIIGRYALDLATVGSFGFAYDIARAASYSSQGLAGWLGGANISDIGALAYAALQAGGGNFEPLTKFAVRQIPIPVVKQQLGNALKEDSNSGSRGGRGGRDSR